MFVNQGIAFETLLQNEFIYVKMTTEYPRDAEQLIDALLRGYMSFLEESEEDRVRRLTVLEKRKRILEDQLEMQRLKIRQGSSELTSRQEMMLQQVATLQETLVEVTIRKILLETQVALKEKNANREITVEDIADQPTDVVESDPIVQPLSWDIRLYEGILRSERETIRLYEGIVNKNRAIMNPSNPVLKRNTEILEEFQRRHKKIEATVALRINEQIEKKQEQIRKQIAQMQRKKLEQLQEELNQMTVYENRIRAKLEEKMGTIGLGLKQFEIEEAQEEFARIMDDYHEIHLGINEVHIEVFSNPQISIASNARSVEAKGKRRKMAGAAAFGGLVMGMGVALLRGKLD